MKLQVSPECLKKSAGEASDQEAVIAKLLYKFGMGVHMLKVHFLLGAGAERMGTHIYCLEVKTLKIGWSS
jgi:hypothetical protein